MKHLLTAGETGAGTLSIIEAAITIFGYNHSEK